MTLYELLQLMKEKWQLLVILPIVCALAMGAYAYLRMADYYTSTASIYVLTKTASTTTGDSGTKITSSDITVSGALAGDITALAESEKVSSAVAKDLGMYTLDDYSVKVSEGSSTRVMQLAVTGPNPETAALIANRMATEVAKLATEIMDFDDVNVVDPARVPDEASGPSHIKYIGVAFLAGLFIAIAIIVLIDMLDTTVRSNKDAEELFGLPVLGQMPYTKKVG